MNPTDAEKLDGLDIAGIGIRRESENNTWMVLYPTSVMDTSPLLLTTASDLLAFCRVGVARVDGERFTVPEWGEVDDKKKRKETLTATEEFILDNEPADPKEASIFREQLLAVIKEST